METLVRWVHPRKVRKDGRLKPSAFRLEEIKAGLLAACDAKCPKQAISLADLSLLEPANREAALKAACRFCEWHRRKKEHWQDEENCDCLYGGYGVKGALASRDGLAASLMDACHVGAYAVPDTSLDNPLHTLLCFHTKNALFMSAIDLPDQILKTLITVFSRVRPTKEILNC